MVTELSLVEIDVLTRILLLLVFISQNVVMLTINVPNLPPSVKLDLQPTGFDFHAKTGDSAKGIQDKEYAFHLDFFAEVEPKESKVSQTSKSLYLVLRKKEASADYWPRLSKDKTRLHNVKTDFAKWRVSRRSSLATDQHGPQLT